jgi:hypothetical protein
MLDNPGWGVEIELNETHVEGKPFNEMSDLDQDADWIRCWIEDQKFNGVADPQKLEQMLHVFLDWAHTHQSNAI